MKLNSHVVSLVAASGLFVLAAGSGKRAADGTTSTEPATDPQGVAPAQTAKAKPAKPEKAYEKVSAGTLMNDYKANEVRADGRWKDQLVSVTGVVDGVSKDAFGGIYVLLGTGAQFELNAIHCQFPKKLESQAASLSKGDKVTINGRVSGMVITSVILDDAELAPSK